MLEENVENPRYRQDIAPLAVLAFGTDKHRRDTQLIDS
jgi:hypothetical protein